ncbi:MAG: 50S ribosomal protein L22 [Planctomycetes bacterium]|jgi:large subunit ribosomal protein L22|nr:50S ribosomal protein L22 [Planctomycetota bacterium]MCL4729404.1 50S ribosomal protein L22 [Planctomycetota bacterium]
MAEEPKKQFQAIARNVRMSARKARLVMDIVRGRNAQEAMTLLRFVNKRAAPEISKLIQSAVANAEDYANRSGVDVDTETLVIADAFVDEGPRMKRWRPRSRGMAHPFTRHTCHMTVRVAEAGHVAEQKQGRPAFARPRKRLSKDQRLAKRAGKSGEKGKAAKPAKAEK